MKPKNWDKLNAGKKKEIAKQLFSSVRGHYIISQALIKAVEVMRTEEYPETSNIEDMEMLLELFPIFKVVNQVKP